MAAAANNSGTGTMCGSSNRIKKNPKGTFTSAPTIKMINLGVFLWAGRRKANGFVIISFCSEAAMAPHEKLVKVKAGRIPISFLERNKMKE